MKDSALQLRQYDDVIRCASIDFSWEDQNRRAERLVNEMLRGFRTTDGFVYEWASARIVPMVMKLSFSKGGNQKMLEFSWDGISDGSAIRGAAGIQEQLTV